MLKCGESFAIFPRYQHSSIWHHPTAAHWQRSEYAPARFGGRLEEAFDILWSFWMFFISYLSSKIRFNMPRHHQGLSSSSDVTCSEMLCFNHLADHGDVVTYGNTWAGLGFQRIELPVCECIGWAWQDEMICRRCIIVSRIIFQSWALEQTFWWTYVVYRITQRACRKSLVLLHLRCTSRLLHLYWVHWDLTTLCDQVQTPTPSNLSLVSLVGSSSLPSGPQL